MTTIFISNTIGRAYNGYTHCIAMTKDIAQPVHLRYFLIYSIVEMDPSYKLYWLVYDIKSISSLPPETGVASIEDIEHHVVHDHVSPIYSRSSIFFQKICIYIYFKIIIIILRNFFMTSIILLTPFFSALLEPHPPNDTRDVDDVRPGGRPSGSQSPTGLSAVGMLRICRWNKSSILGGRSTRFSPNHSERSFQHP